MSHATKLGFEGFSFKSMLKKAPAERVSFDGAWGPWDSEVSHKYRALKWPQLS